MMSSTLFVKAFLQGGCWVVLTVRNGSVPCFLGLLGLFNSPCAASANRHPPKGWVFLRTLLKLKNCFKSALAKIML